MNENSSTLRRRILGHTSRDRIKRLANNGILITLNFADFEACVDFIKEKKTKKSKKGAKRTIDILEIIHSDICWPDMDAHTSSPL